MNNYAVLSKATNMRITPHYLEVRSQAAISKGYSKQKWVEFCEVMIGLGYTVTLYEARRTFSKYITVSHKMSGKKKQFKVRFSNHRPIAVREAAKDCDFFVGVSNFKTTTTAQAIEATKAFFDPSAHNGAQT